MRKNRIFYVVLSLFLLLIHSTLTHAGPRQITYKDYLKDPSTSIPYNGTYYVEFRLYNTSTSGILEFCEVQSITIDNGNIFAHIGKATTGGIPDPVFLPPSSDDYLEVAVGTSISGSGGYDPINLTTPCLYSSLTTHSPRIELDAAAYVYHAKKADDADTCTACSNADTVDYKHASDFSSAVHTHNYDSIYVNEGQVNSITSTMIVNGTIGADDLGINVVGSVDGVIPATKGGNIDLIAGSGITITPNDGADTITIACTATGSGDITGVNAGTGLSGGGLIGDVTLNLDSTFQLPQTCTNGQLPQWNITSSTWTCVSSSSVADTRCDALGNCAAVYGGPTVTGMITSGMGVTGTTSTGRAGVYGFSENSAEINSFGVLGIHKGVGVGLYGMTTSNILGVAAIRGENFGAGTGLHGETHSSNPDASGLYAANLGQGHGLTGYTKSTLNSAAAINAWNEGPGYGILAGSLQGIAMKVYTPGGNGTAILAEGDIIATGHIYAQTSTLVGDIAEPVLTAPNVESGDVVIINSPDGTFNSLFFTKSISPYDTRVAGIISTSPSMILANDKDRLPLAVSGIVPVKVDTSYGEINPGDLLTSSPTSGYAMKVSDHAKAQGAIIGKALERLKDGQGKIMVLVTLQ